MKTVPYIKEINFLIPFNLNKNIIVNYHQKKDVKLLTDLVVSINHFLGAF